MDKKLIYITFLLLIFTFIFTLLSCNSEPKYTSQEWEEMKDEENEKEELSQISIEDTGNEKEKDDYFEKLNKYEDFVNNLAETDNKYFEEENRLYEKFHSTTDISKQVAYAELMMDLYENWFRDVSEIKVPVFMEGTYNYILEFLSNQKLWYEYFTRNAEYNTGDPNKLLEYENNASLAYTRMQKEYERIYEEFNNEADELGLEKHFPVNY